MYYRARRALACLKCAADDVLAALRQHLNRHIGRYHIVLYQRAQKFILGLARCGESDLYLLKADRKQHLIILELFFKAHRNDKALIAVAHIDAAPHGRLFDMVALCPFVIFFIDRKISDMILA